MSAHEFNAFDNWPKWLLCMLDSLYVPTLFLLQKPKYRFSKKDRWPAHLLNLSISLYYPTYLIKISKNPQFSKMRDLSTFRLEFRYNRLGYFGQQLFTSGFTRGRCRSDQFGKALIYGKQIFIILLPKVMECQEICNTVYCNQFISTLESQYCDACIIEQKWDYYSYHCLFNPLYHCLPLRQKITLELVLRVAFRFKFCVEIDYGHWLFETNLRKLLHERLEICQLCNQEIINHKIKSNPKYDLYLYDNTYVQCERCCNYIWNICTIKA